MRHELSRNFVFIHVRTPAFGARLEERDCLIDFADLRIAPRGRLEHSGLLEPLATLAEKRLEPGPLKREGNLLRLLGRGHRLAQRYGFVEKPLVPERSSQPEEGHAELRVQLERPPGLGDCVIVAAGPIESPGQVRVDDQ